MAIIVYQVNSLICSSDRVNIIHCPKCGYKHTFCYVFPSYCNNCRTKLPKLAELLDPTTAPVKRLEYHKTGMDEKNLLPKG